MAKREGMITPLRYRHSIHCGGYRGSGNPFEETVCTCGAMFRRVQDAEAKADRLQANVDALPKCWQLVDGKLEQSRPIVPGMQVWTVGPTVVRRDVLAVQPQSVVLVCWGKCLAKDLADSLEAAEAAGGE